MKIPRLPRWSRAIIACGLLAALYCAADWRAVGQVLISLRPGYLAAALFLFLPQTVISAWRWQGLARTISRISLTEALRQTLAAAALNLVVPGKLGDLSKCAMLPSPMPGSTPRGAALVVQEKLLDVAALLAVAGVGWLGCGSAAWLVAAALLSVVWFYSLVRIEARRGRWLRWLGASLVLWTLHMMQVEWFLYAAHVDVASSMALARLPWAIFAGLLPFTLWGVGTRDAALVWLFADAASPAPLAAVGMLTALRYLVPGACGILFVGNYVSARRTPLSTVATPQGNSTARSQRRAVAA